LKTLRIILIAAASSCLLAIADADGALRYAVQSSALQIKVAGARQSIRNWVSCDGRTDESTGLAHAFAAARHGAFTLVIDCPVRVHIGMDIAKPIFIDDGTSVEFAGGGKLTLDNVFIPAFVIVDSSHIALTNWNVEYDASLPVSQKVGGHERNGHFETGALPPNAFNDGTLTPWLSANRRIVFDRSSGAVNSKWSGGTNLCAVFFIAGDTSDLHVSGMHIYAPPGAGGERFIPVVFSLNSDYKPNQTVTSQTPASAQYIAIPHDLAFSDITLDGTYMGWVGGVRDATFENITSHRYGDWQDASGGHVGGEGKWFAPPHLFYFSYQPTGDPGLFNRNIRIDHVVDDGPRVGTARDRGGSDSLSGYALSLKIGCVDCSVNHYRSNRPDGFLDLLPSDGITISNVEATYDSSFLNNVFPGWRFPSSSYKNVTFKDIAFQDTAQSSVRPPIGDANQPSNEHIVFDHVRVTLNRWAGTQAVPLPIIAGQGNELALDFIVEGDATRIAEAQRGGVGVTLRVRAAPPSSVELSWAAQRAQSCIVSGAWTGSVPTSGSRSVEMRGPGNHDFTLSCQSGGNTATVSVPEIIPGK
jgi:hypothetical protein